MGELWGANLFWASLCGRQKSLSFPQLQKFVRNWRKYHQESRFIESSKPIFQTTNDARCQPGGVGKSWFCARGFQLSAPNRWCRSCHCQSCYWTDQPWGNTGWVLQACADVPSQPVSVAASAHHNLSRHQSEIPHCPYAKMEQLTPSRAPSTRSSMLTVAPCDPCRSIPTNSGERALGAPTLATTSKTSRCVACGPKTRAKRKLYLGRLGQVWPVPMENRTTVICSRSGLQIPNYLLEVPQMQIISRLKFRLLVDEPHSYFAHTVASTKKCEIRFKVGDGTWQVTPPPDCWLYRFLEAMARSRKLAMTLIAEYWVHTMNKCIYIYTKSNVIRITSHLWVQKGTHLIYFSWNGLQFRSHHKPCCSALPSGDPCIANHLGHVPKTSAGWLETTGSSFELRWREKNAGKIHKPSQLRFGKTTFI